MRHAGLNKQSTVVHNRGKGWIASPSRVAPRRLSPFIVWGATVLPVNQLGHRLTDCCHAPRRSSFPSPPLTEVSPAIDPDSLRRRTQTVIIDPDIFRLLDPIILPSIIRLSISGMKIGRTLLFTNAKKAQHEIFLNSLFYLNTVLTHHLNIIQCGCIHFI